MSRLYIVRMKGVEPPRRKALDPKSSMSTNSITSADSLTKVIWRRWTTKLSTFNFLS